MSSLCVLLRTKRVRDASNRRRGGAKYQRQQENKRARAEAEAQGDRIDTALQIMSSLARSLETSLGNHEDDW